MEIGLVLIYWSLSSTKSIHREVTLNQVKPRSETPELVMLGTAVSHPMGIT